STGNAPHEKANQKSPCMRPPKSSKLYANTNKTPSGMKSSRPTPTLGKPARPTATASTSAAAPAVFKTQPGIDVRRGRPLSSSKACAAIPTARKKAMSVVVSRNTLTFGASAAPITTYERCQAVYGGGG